MRLIWFEEFFKIHLIARQKTLISCLVKMLKRKETFSRLHASHIESKSFEQTLSIMKLFGTDESFATIATHQLGCFSRYLVLQYYSFPSTAQHA